VTATAVAADTSVPVTARGWRATARGSAGELIWGPLRSTQPLERFVQGTTFGPWLRFYLRAARSGREAPWTEDTDGLRQTASVRVAHILWLNRDTARASRAIRTARLARRRREAGRRGRVQVRYCWSEIPVVGARGLESRRPGIIASVPLRPPQWNAGRQRRVAGRGREHRGRRRHRGLRGRARQHHRQGPPEGSDRGHHPPAAVGPHDEGPPPPSGREPRLLRGTGASLPLQGRSTLFSRSAARRARSCARRAVRGRSPRGGRRGSR